MTQTTAKSSIELRKLVIDTLNHCEMQGFDDGETVTILLEQIKEKYGKPRICETCGGVIG